MSELYNGLTKEEWLASREPLVQVGTPVKINMGDTPETDALITPDNKLCTDWGAVVTLSRSLELRLAEALKARNFHIEHAAKDKADMIEALRQRDDLRAENERLRQALEPFAALELGKQGYCSYPLTIMCEEARAALAQEDKA